MLSIIFSTKLEDRKKYPDSRVQPNQCTTTDKTSITCKYGGRKIRYLIVRFPRNNSKKEKKTRGCLHS